VSVHRPRPQVVPLTDSRSYPIYRHPADESPPLRPFSPTVSKIRAHVERALQHPVNHVLIQLYRTGADYISEHSDKTIDVVRDSRIVNLSLGARRTMTLKTKKDSGVGDDDEQRGPRRTQRVPLPHNSLFVMGLQTNARWMHSVHTDKRPEGTKEPAERGARISLTFRRIGTFLTPTAQQRIYGQGATGKTRAEARPVVQGGAQAERLLAAFGAENHQSEFDWDGAYGEGFDVLHFAAAAAPGEPAEGAGEVEGAQT
jgi:alkylated DNA repair dioxygenase AlkB